MKIENNIKISAILHCFSSSLTLVTLLCPLHNIGDNDFSLILEGVRGKAGEDMAAQDLGFCSGFFFGDMQYS